MMTKNRNAVEEHDPMGASSSCSAGTRAMSDPLTP